ncbi:MAG: copper homeostasis protein CutC, partial [Bacteroidia bacterium]|nr:copper homeostasis protein CutC [Bacteroidia bacterium]
AARGLLNETKLNVIIRPRGGDFLYSELEHHIMLKDIEICRKLGVDGIVIGCLTAEGDVDMPRCKELVDAAGEMSVTFHRAFDMCRHPFKALEDIISLGCNIILTSGQQPKAEQGVELLEQLVKQAGNRIVIMPGSGVNAQNIAEIARKTGANEFHLSARESVESQMEYRNPNLKMGGANIVINEYAQDITSAAKVNQTLQQLQNL